ncbi:hypothetical protein PILCRDRAFT_810542 [Piloderma croceum F 1598]|uniref:BTB domain-containing protein n=1 Tax=Piloderma croceum (strain F 1598) TaxID=765440 RepID=A0A0C3CNI4_PILCF|nr:hypothetical protein PILCRDRAFT_810542 [Piloderma croceum F 1598]
MEPETTVTFNDDTAQSYDPLFASSDGDFVLRSSDGKQFRIHAFTLRTASEFFRTMLSLPQGSEVNDSIALDEPSNVIGPLLRMISGMEIPKWESYDEIEGVLEAAHKYDMAGPISVMRVILISPRFLAEPLRLYVMAIRFDWPEEAKLAAEQSLALSIHDTKYLSLLEQIPSRPLLKLLDLHRKRKDGFRNLIHDLDRFIPGNRDPSYCSKCSEMVDNSPWRRLKSVMISEMDMRPMGDTLIGTVLEERPEASACWEAKCKQCSEFLYERAVTLRELSISLDLLPTSV